MDVDILMRELQNVLAQSPEIRFANECLRAIAESTIYFMPGYSSLADYLYARYFDRCSSYLTAYHIQMPGCDELLPKLAVLSGESIQFCPFSAAQCGYTIFFFDLRLIGILKTSDDLDTVEKAIPIYQEKGLPVGRWKFHKMKLLQKFD